MEAISMLMEKLDIRVVQHSNHLNLDMQVLGDIYVFQLPGRYLFWGHHMLGLVHGVIISADVIFASQKLRYHESDDRLFILI